MSPNPYQRQFEIAGADIEATKTGKCRTCHAEILVGQVRDRHTKSLKWRNLSSKPTERDGRLFYLRHACPR